jgi:hypothetical protein
MQTEQTKCRECNTGVTSTPGGCCADCYHHMRGAEDVDIDEDMTEWACPINTY